MTYNSVKSLAFAAGCVLALGAMPAAHAQTYGQTQPYGQPNAQPSGQAYVQPSVQPNQQPYGSQVAALPPQVETNGPQASAGDFGGWSARRNVAESMQYDRLLQTSPGFRQARMRKECGSINDPQLHDQCMASFNEYEPASGAGRYNPRRG